MYRLVLEPLTNCSASVPGRILRDPQAFIQRAVQAAVEDKLKLLARVRDSKLTKEDE